MLEEKAPPETKPMSNFEGRQRFHHGHDGFPKRTVMPIGMGTRPHKMGDLGGLVGFFGAIFRGRAARIHWRTRNRISEPFPSRTSRGKTGVEIRDSRGSNETWNRRPAFLFLRLEFRFSKLAFRASFRKGNGPERHPGRCRQSATTGSGAEQSKLREPDEGWLDSRTQRGIDLV